MENSNIITENSEEVNLQQNPKTWLGQDPLTLLGIGLLMLTSGCFYISIKENLNARSDFFGGAFIFSFVIEILYGCLLLGNGLAHFFWKKEQRNSRKHVLILWSIWIVGCFSLNKSIQIFYESTGWFSVMICVSIIVHCAFAWKEQIRSTFLRSMLYLFLSFSFIIWLYFSIYLLPMYPISTIALPFLGISLHTFVPLFTSILLLKILYDSWKIEKKAIIFAFCSIGVCIIVFVTTYYSKAYQIQSYKADAFVTKTDDLPIWVRLAQRIDDGWVTERVLKSNLIYQKVASDWSFSPFDNNLHELLQHDPLVLIASIVSPDLDIDQQERIKIIESRFDARHNTQERLWSGENLSVSNVITQTKIYPQYRLAYTEKTISIHNSNKDSPWRTEEALFTFFVPEGTAVTSLSLWINGREEKGILTTQSKADSAYKTIVGIENRDPSVIHWQEGNRLIIKVFPCTPKENRRFKVGFTSPLKYEKDRNSLIYNNIYFKGPSLEGTDENVYVEFDKPMNKVNSSRYWDESSNIKIQHHGEYEADWNLSFEAPKLSESTFQFQGKNYQLLNYISDNEAVSWDKIYLDIDKYWEKNEVEKILKMAQNKSVMVWNDEWITLTNQNLDMQFEELTKQEFSLFPVTKIKNPEKALLITKSASNSPILQDLGDSNLMKSFKEYQQVSPIRTFVLEGLSPYLKTLKELRIIRCVEGSWQNLEAHIRDNSFPKDIENQSVIKIDNAGFSIQETQKITPEKAPDHLLRLFAYNQVLSQIGHAYFYKNTLEENLINTASLGNVVTPISSMIVLETQADYDRFDVKKSKNGLDNATLKKSGAVPEPHEWALIGIVCLIMIYHFKFRNRAVKNI
jgi:XrtN system VIT domain protein